MTTDLPAAKPLYVFPQQLDSLRSAIAAALKTARRRPTPWGDAHALHVGCLISLSRHLDKGTHAEITMNPYGHPDDCAAPGEPDAAPSPQTAKLLINHTLSHDPTAPVPVTTEFT